MDFHMLIPDERGMIFVNMFKFDLIVCIRYEKMFHFSLMGKHRTIEEYIRQTAAKEKQKIKESVLEGIYTTE